MQRGAVSNKDRRGPVHAIAELALMRVDAAPYEETLRQVAELAKQSLPTAMEVSLTVLDGHRPRTVVFTGQLAADSPYREFAKVAALAGVRQTVAIGLPLGRYRTGAVNIYSSAESPLIQGLLEDAQAFTAYAAVVINNVSSYAEAANEVANLRVAMGSRSVIEQAKGIVMAFARCTADEAFDLLRQISQDQNVKIHRLAQALVDSIR